MKRVLLLLAMLCIIPAFISANFTYVTQFNGLDSSSIQYHPMAQPTGVWVDGNTIYVTNSKLHELRLFDKTTLNSTRRIGGTLGSDDNTFDSPQGVSVSATSVYVADTYNNEIKAFRKSDLSFDFLLGAASTSGSVYALSNPKAAIEYNGLVFVADTNDNRISIFNKSSSNSNRIYYGALGGGATTFGDYNFNVVPDIWIDDSGLCLYVVDEYNNRIQKYSFDSSLDNFTYLGSFGNGLGGINLFQPQGVCVSGDYVFALDTGNSRIVVFTQDFKPIEVFGGLGNSTELFNSPQGIYCDGSSIYVADTNNMRVVIYNYTAPNENETTQFVSSSEAKEEITSTASTLYDIKALIAVASPLGLSVDYSSVQANIDAANASYAAGNYPAAKSTATQAYSDAQQMKSQFENLLASNLSTTLADDRARESAVQAKISQYSLNASLNLTDQYLANATQHIQDMDYRNAIGALGKADMQLKLIEAINVSGPTIVPPNIGNSPFASDIMELTAQKDELIANASEYQQAISTSDFDQLITLASNPSTPPSEAIAALADARSRILTLQQNLDATIAKINSAKEKIADSQAAIDEVTSTRNILASADTRAALATLEQARSSLYSDPDMSSELAGQAQQLAAAEKQRVDQVGATIPLLFGGFALIIVIAVAGVYIYLKRKSSRRR